MHDPSVLVFDVPVIDLDIWHVEPGGHDSGEVCGHLPARVVPRTLWMLRHARHLRLRFWPYLNIHRWIVDRCEECGKRFRWRETRTSYQSTDKVWHGVCMTLLHVRGQLEDLTAYVRAEADDNARWRVEYRLKHLDGATDG